MRIKIIVTLFLFILLLQIIISSAVLLLNKNKTTSIKKTSADEGEIIFTEYSKAEKYIEGGWRETNKLNAGHQTNSLYFELSGSPNKPVPIYNQDVGTMTGLLIRNKDMRKIRKIQFDYVANFDTNLLSFDISVSNKSQLWLLEKIGINTVTINTDSPWVGFGFKIIRPFPNGIPFNWFVRINNIKLYLSDDLYDDTYKIYSRDKTVLVEVSKKYGGMISGIYDFINLPNQNMIAGWHGGAGLQTAFWLEPKFSNVPEGCNQLRPDMWYNNPTQGGYYADVVSGSRYGNPIGFFGNDMNTLDNFEFITTNLYNTIYLRSRLIRHDFCKYPKALISYQSLWDTNFYVENWISFDDIYYNTLKYRVKILYIGNTDIEMGTRQFPVIFAHRLPYATYIKNGVIKFANKNSPITPDNRWIAILNESKQSGLGLVVNPKMTYFHYPNMKEENADFGFEYHLNDNVSVIWPSNLGFIDLNTFGISYNIKKGDAYKWIFKPGATYEYIVYIPIGSFNYIRQVSEKILKERY